MLEQRERWNGGSLEDVIMRGSENSVREFGCDQRAGEIRK